MKRFLSVLALSISALAFAACGQAQAATGGGAAQPAETILVNHRDGQTLVPINPTRVAVYDFAIVDTLYHLGIAHDVIIATNANAWANTHLAHLENAFNHAGTLHEPDLEALAALDPDLIIISGRAAPHINELNQLAPTINLGAINEDFMGGFAANNTYLGQIFGMQEEVSAALATIDNQIAELTTQATALNKTALIMLHNDGSLRAFGPNSRFGLIHEVGIAPVNPDIEVVGHGYVISNEFIIAHNPDMLLVFDRNAIAAGEAASRQDIENEIVQLTNAYQNNNIFYMDSGLWYLAQGGLGGMFSQISELESILSQIQ